VNDLVSDQLISKTKALVDLIPLGRIDQLAVSIIAANLQALLGLNTDVLEPRPDPEYALLAQRQQFDALKIIKELSNETHGALFKLSVTELDICTPILTFVYGESQLGGKIALISLNRLQGGNLESAYERAAKIGVHEVGHLLGLEHCWEVRCLMHFSRNLEQLDSLPLQFCSACEFETARRIRNLEGR
jgi:archaemetzincin